jgi:hypothetical protein
MAFLGVSSENPLHTKWLTNKESFHLRQSDPILPIFQDAAQVSIFLRAVFFSHLSMDARLSPMIFQINVTYGDLRWDLIISRISDFKNKSITNAETICNSLVEGGHRN